MQLATPICPAAYTRSSFGGPHVDAGKTGRRERSLGDSPALARCQNSQPRGAHSRTAQLTGVIQRPANPSIHTRRPKLPTVLSISQYTRRNCAIHIPIYSRAISRNASFLLLHNILQCIKEPNCSPAVEPQTTSTCCHEGASAICSCYYCSCRQISTNLFNAIAYESSRT